MPKSKREIIRERRRKRQMKGRVTIIVLVTVGAVLLGGALILSSNGGISKGNVDASITPITARTFNAPVDKNTIGDPNARVKMDVWEDFQCSGCMFYTRNIEPEIFQTYVETGKVFYTSHFFPFIDGGDLQGESHQSANATMCAVEQGRFWDYHDILFANWLGENVGAYTDARLVAFAKNIGLDMKAFNKCFRANTYADQINSDYQAGLKMGVPPTPGIFVDGKIVSSAAGGNRIPTFDEISQAIETALSGSN